MSIATPFTCVQRRVDRDRGSSTVELAVVAPLALILLLGVLQAGLWFHSRSLCTHAAQQGATAAATVTGSNSTGQQAARGFLAQSATAATAPTVSVQAGPEQATVRVAATAPLVLPIPGLQIPVEHTARVSTERFTTPGANP